ncbi:MAG: hypothetical protein B7X41_17980 [Microbacterium sp. 14-71-5]|nr:MAG: hypothetical protein B7X41_17980 [Microbacterium sp. 14-71-5]OZB84330.1 MAG: hypothetical protein B7X32_07560 [Microbacterium sp. 13-71-7]
MVLVASAARLIVRYVCAMARAHGFRVFVVQAFPNQRKGRDALDASDSSTVRGEVIELLEALFAQGTKTFAPRPPDNGEPEKPTVSVTVHEPVVVSQGMVHVAVAMGESGSHRQATRTAKKPKNLEKWSPEQDHSVAFLFPRDIEDRFLIVVQTIKRRDPLKRLLSLMTRESYDRRKKAEAREKLDRKKARERREPLPAKQVHFKLLFEANQAADNEYLDSILSGADSATATFKSTRASSRGSNRPEVSRVLRITLRDADVQDVGRAIGRTWSARRRRGEKMTQVEGVSELAALLYERDLLDEDEGDRYENAAISVRSDARDTTTIAVDTLRDVFTYPVSDGPPSTWFYYDRVAPRVATIARQERLPISTIDPREVEECLKG